ncbi:MAG: hypothetical protein ACD_11C00149G0004 [uncultured bacterium]|nr:MAG: hypothetical protein ACD_11C00149G0004 [uncultured bacterium]
MCYTNGKKKKEKIGDKRKWFTLIMLVGVIAILTGTSFVIENIVWRVVIVACVSLCSMYVGHRYDVIFGNEKLEAKGLSSSRTLSSIYTQLSKLEYLVEQQSRDVPLSKKNFIYQLAKEKYQGVQGRVYYIKDYVLNAMRDWSDILPQLGDYSKDALTKDIKEKERVLLEEQVKNSPMSKQVDRQKIQELRKELNQKKGEINNLNDRINNYGLALPDVSGMSYLESGVGDLGKIYSEDIGDGKLNIYRVG